eukprot:1602-Heterococcus_DN1.PRE.1
MSKLEAILIDIDRDSKESLISGSSIESAQHNARRARRQAFADAGAILQREGKELKITTDTQTIFSVATPATQSLHVSVPEHKQHYS